MTLYEKLNTRILALVRIKNAVDEAGEFGDLYEDAENALFDVFAAIGEVGTMSEPPLDKKAQTVCAREGATLHVWGTDVVHTKDGKETVVEEEHMSQGGTPLGAIVVDGFTWSWGEMADGTLTRILALVNEVEIAEGEQS